MVVCWHKLGEVVNECTLHSSIVLAISVQKITTTAIITTIIINTTTTTMSVCQDSSDFSSFQLDRLMKQSQLSARLESVRQELSYNAGSVEDIVQDAGEDATVESNRLASDDLTQYVLIKGNVDKEKEQAASDKDATEKDVR